MSIPEKKTRVPRLTKARTAGAAASGRATLNGFGNARRITASTGLNFRDAAVSGRFERAGHCVPARWGPVQRNGRNVALLSFATLALAGMAFHG